MVRITFPDGEAREYPDGITPQSIAREISEGLSRIAIGALLNGTLIDINRPITTDGEIKLITDKDVAGLEILRHTAAHVLAQAVKRIKPGVQLGFGPSIEDGFYYDFLSDKPFTPDDLESFEKEMHKIVKEDIPVTCEVLPKTQILEKLKKSGEDLKIAHVGDLEDEELSIYS
ncbi:MAG: TGS domain-containing protein, partial [bacterium]